MFRALFALGFSSSSPVRPMARAAGNLILVLFHSCGFSGQEQWGMPRHLGSVAVELPG